MQPIIQPTYGELHGNEVLIHIDRISVGHGRNRSADVLTFPQPSDLLLILPGIPTEKLKLPHAQHTESLSKKTNQQSENCWHNSQQGIKPDPESAAAAQKKQQHLVSFSSKKVLKLYFTALFWTQRKKRTKDWTKQQTQGGSRFTPTQKTHLFFMAFKKKTCKD